MECGQQRPRSGSRPIWLSQSVVRVCAPKPLLPDKSVSSENVASAPKPRLALPDKRASSENENEDSSSSPSSSSDDNENSSSSSSTPSTPKEELRLTRKRLQSELGELMEAVAVHQEIEAENDLLENRVPKQKTNGDTR